MSLPLSFKIPGAYITIVFGAGPQSPLNAPRTAIIVDYGTAGALNTPTPIASADDAGATFGYGSHIYLAAKAFYEEFTFGTLYACRMAEAGGGVAQAKTLTIATNAATGGSLFIDINGLPKIEVVVLTGDTPTVQAAAVAAAITARPQYPCTATAALGVVTLTWKQKGLRSTQFKLRTSVTGITGSTYTIADTVAGITDGDPTAALTALAIADYDIIITGANTSDASTGLPPYVTVVNSRSGPLIGLRGCVCAASVDTYGTSIALSLALNAHRLQILWCRNADMTTVEIAAKMAAIRCREEGSDPAFNFDYQQFEVFRGPYSASDRISLVEANNALNSGLTPIGINRQGAAYIWRSITSRYQDLNGGPDYRVLDTSKVTVVDYIADFIASDYLRMGYQRMKLRDDTQDQRPVAGVITPKIVRNWLVGILKQGENEDPVVLKNVDAHLNELVVALSDVVPGRVNATIPLDVIDGFHQFDATLLQIG